MRKTRFLFTVIVFAFACSLFANGKKDSNPKPLVFEEAWGYVSMARAYEYNDELPLTDVCYFAADVNCYGELIDIPDINKIKVTGKRRHMTFICDSKSLTHFILSPDSPYRASIINQIVEAVQPFEGLNIDVELVPARDRYLFLSFVSELRERLPEKMLSVCVPARTKRLSSEVYPYTELAEIADRIFIMAYDEHWSGGKPGPVASLEWCKNVAAFAKKSMASEKIIMGIPFYGRTWSDKTTSSAWTYPTLQRLFEENEVTDFTYENGIPTFSFTTEVTVTGYMNDLLSVHALASGYKKDGITKIGYWRIGQEDPAIWNYLLIKKE